MTRAIHQLPPNLINRIAAGEVIERPASVVKELVENSLDAGAKQITIEIEDGGLALIRIIDDGSGIPAGELPLAFASHATSKLLNDDDLFNIATMGFRGEALASIGSVAHARILSRTGDNASAAEISNRGGELSGVQAAAGNGGTVIEVRNLFFNTPARRKFLKGPSTEYGHIADAVLRLALPYPGVAFRLLHNNRCTLNLPATTAHDRLLAAWPGDFHAQAMSLEADDAEIQLTGLIGLPELARPTAKHQYIYLNGRSIRDRFIQHALREAYRGLTEPGRHPAAILMIGIPPQDVDVNVHPTKSEVRFKNSGRIHSLVLSGVRQQLLGNDLTPRAMPQVQASVAQPRPDLRAQLAAFLKGDAPAPFAQELADSSPVAPSSTTMAVPMAAPHYALPRMAQSAPAAPVAAMPAETDKAIQLHNSYLVAQSDDGLVIIDQHALHERIMYEELLARLSRGTLESQAMLIPQPFGVSARQMDLLKQIEPLLQRLGIEIVPFGPDTAAVQAFPTFLEKLDPIRFITELLERGEQELLDLHDEELLHEVLDMMACKAAIKAGDPLTPAEVQALLAQRDLVERSSNCPHGRPTTLRLSLKDLEKQFKRTGF